MDPTQSPTTHATLFAVRRDGRPDQVSVRCEADNWRVSPVIVVVKIDAEVQLVEVEIKTDKRQRYVRTWESVFPCDPTLEQMIIAAESLARKQWQRAHGTFSR